MRVKCLYNNATVLFNYEIRPPGISKSTNYGYLNIGAEYLVTGIFYGENILTYLIDDGKIIFACPYQLFEVIDSRLPSNWFFKAFTLNDAVFPYQQAIWGYYELCFDEDHYQKLVDIDADACQIYFQRKTEIERLLQIV